MKDHALTYKFSQDSRELRRSCIIIVPVFDNIDPVQKCLINFIVNDSVSKRRINYRLSF